MQIGGGRVGHAGHNRGLGRLLPDGLHGRFVSMMTKLLAAALAVCTLSATQAATVDLTLTPLGPTSVRPGDSLNVEVSYRFTGAVVDYLTVLDSEPAKALGQAQWDRWQKGTIYEQQETTYLQLSFNGAQADWGGFEWFEADSLYLDYGVPSAVFKETFTFTFPTAGAFSIKAFVGLNVGGVDDYMRQSVTRTCVADPLTSLWCDYAASTRSDAGWVTTTSQNLSSTLNVQVSAVPEPQTWLLALGGLVVLGGLVRHRRAT